MIAVLLALLAPARADDACAEARTGLLVVDAPFDTVEVVEIDGAPVPFKERAGGRRVPAGLHRVRIVVDEARVFEADVEVAPCARVEKLLDVGAGRWSDEAEPAALAPARPKVDVRLGPLVTARLDGAPLATGVIEIAKGSHALDVDRSPCVQHFQVTVGADGLLLRLEPGGLVFARPLREGEPEARVPTTGSTCDVVIGERW